MKKILFAFLALSFSCAAFAKAEVPSTHAYNKEFVKPQNETVVFVQDYGMTCYQADVAVLSVAEAQTPACVVDMVSTYVDPVISAPTPPPAVCNGPPVGINS